MLDAACGDTHRGGRPSIPPSATDPAAVTVAAASSETTTRPPSSVAVDVTATAVTTASDIADDARYDPAVNVNGGSSPASLVDDAYDGGAGNTLVQSAVVSVILIAAKSYGRMEDRRTKEEEEEGQTAQNSTTM
jgi:hypothetical protein